MTNLISSEDVKNIAISLGKILTVEDINYVLENYSEDNRTTDNWTVIVEDLIYQLPK